MYDMTKHYSKVMFPHIDFWAPSFEMELRRAASWPYGFDFLGSSQWRSGSLLMFLKIPRFDGAL